MAGLRKALSTRFAVVGALVVLVGAACDSGWTTQQPSDNSSVSAPSDWVISSDETGRITATSPADKGEMVVIQPVFTEAALEPGGAAAVLATMGARIEKNVRWQRPEPRDDSTVLMRGTANGQDAVAILIYAVSETGTAGNVFVALAPSGRLTEDADTFARIMTSVQVSGPSYGAQPRPTIAYRTFPNPSDRQEVASVQGAFSLEMPRDADLSGQMTIAGSVSEWFVQADSPSLGVQMGNYGFPIYYVPGFYRAGTTINDVTGVHPVQPYTPGAQYVVRMFGPARLADFKATQT